MAHTEPAMLGGRRLLLLAQLLLAILAWTPLSGVPAAAADDATAVWAGTWDTKWRGGSAQLTIRQSGDEVTGVYPSYGGRIAAKAFGRELRGTWYQAGESGELQFVLSPDGQSFMGRFSDVTGEWWSGVRADTDRFDFIHIDQSSPAEVMRSFVEAFNESGADAVYRPNGGSMALASKAAALIDVSRANLEDSSHLDYARTLFSVIDHLTFRLWDLPHASLTQDETTLALGQAGSTVTFDVTFRKKDGAWFIVGPPLSTLVAKRDELARARGVPPDLIADPAKLRSPRDAFKTLLGAVAISDDTLAQSALDMRNFTPAVRAAEAELLTQFLKRVIDRIGYVVWQEIPDDPSSKVPYVFLEHPAGDIVVGPVETDDGVIWQFTAETLADVRGLYADVEPLPVLPEFRETGGDDPYFATRSLANAVSPALLERAGPVERWQWLLLVGFGLLGLVLGYVASTIFRFFRRRGYRKRNEPVHEDPLIDWSIRVIGFGAAQIVGLRLLGLPEIVATPVLAIAWTAILIGAVPVAWVLVGRVADAYRVHFPVPGYHQTLIALLTGLVRVILVVVAFLLLAEVLAIPYQGVIAGLGIGGLAVALAAQPTLQNFLSGITLYADRPVSVGDYCRFGDKAGTIEHIGMRSTRIRTPERTVISIPNSEFANMKIENFAPRDRTQMRATLQLRRETTPDQLRVALASLRELLVAHPMVADDSRVRFVGIGESAFELEISAYVLTPRSPEFLAIREDLYLGMLERLAAAGVQLAMPSLLRYEASELAPDPGQQAQAQQAVAAWRQEGKLPFPDFDEEQKEALQGSVPYPPVGSASKDETGYGPPARQPE